MSEAFHSFQEQTNHLLLFIFGSKIVFFEKVENLLSAFLTYINATPRVAGADAHSSFAFLHLFLTDVAFGDGHEFGVRLLYLCNEILSSLL